MRLSTRKWVLLITAVGLGVLLFIKLSSKPGPSLTDIQARGGLLNWVFARHDPLRMLHTVDAGTMCSTALTPAVIYDDSGRLQFVRRKRDATLTQHILIDYEHVQDGVAQQFTLYDEAVLDSSSKQGIVDALRDKRVTGSSYHWYPAVTCKNQQAQSHHVIDYQCDKHAFYLRYDARTGLLETNLLGGDLSMWLNRSGLIVAEEQRDLTTPKGHPRPSFWDNLAGRSPTMPMISEDKMNRRVTTTPDQLITDRSSQMRADRDWFSRHLLADEHSGPLTTKQYKQTITQRDQQGNPIVWQTRKGQRSRYHCKPLN